mmetsp:Transcript_8788/g.12452  ORF Transcript_8788/g.12452 Transcript_8788/m.12452 type:complete len:83 (-) Transcript_8788:1963-2211(-)
MGCPTTQKDTQNTIFPMELAEKFLTMYFVTATKGICIIIPKNDHGRTIWNGTLTKTSCMTADKKNTMKVEAPFDSPSRMLGK